MSYWTEARMEHAAKLWRDGLSAAAIATKLGGVSRNAVIGKVNRRPDIFAPRREKQQRKVEPRPKETKQHAARPKATAGLFRAPAKVVEPATAPIFAPARKPGLYRHRGLPIKGTGSVPFALLGTFQCSWPLTDFEDAGGPEMPCCGRPRRGGLVPDSSYCLEHAAVSRGAA